MVFLQVIYDRITQRSRGFAFVTMSTVRDAMAAMEKLDGIVRSNIPLSQ
jgi:RNA recognition motif-containing protein